MRGYIGKSSSTNTFLVVTKGPYEGFLISGYEAKYKNKSGKNVTLPAGTRFTNYGMPDEEGNIIVVDPSQSKEEGTRHARFSLALHSVKDGGTIYLEDDITIGFMAKLKDGVGSVTIDGQGHTITRDTFSNPNTMLMALDAEGVESYTGSIFQIGEGDTVTLKNVTIDAGGKWEIDEDKLKQDIELSLNEIDVLGEGMPGHPVNVLEGNIVSTGNLIEIAGGTLKLDGVTMENFYAGDNSSHSLIRFITEYGELDAVNSAFRHNAARTGLVIGGTNNAEIHLGSGTVIEDNYCFGGYGGGMISADNGTQVYLEAGARVINNAAADCNGVFIRVYSYGEDPDAPGQYRASELHMKGGEVAYNVGIRGSECSYCTAIELDSTADFTMEGGSIHDNTGCYVSGVNMQNTADSLELLGGNIYNNTCSTSGGKMTRDIYVLGDAQIGADMVLTDDVVIENGGALINNGDVTGSVYVSSSVFSYTGKMAAFTNNGKVEGNLYLQDGANVTNGESGEIVGDVKIINSLEATGTSDFHNEGKIDGNVEIAENSHLYNSGEIYGDVAVKSGGTLTLNCNDPSHMDHGGAVYGDVTVYPSGLIRADVTPTYVDGTITFEYEDEADRERMKEVLEDSGITCAKVAYVKHEHTKTGVVTRVEPKCTETGIEIIACGTCGEEFENEVLPALGHDMYVYDTIEATCTAGAKQIIRCRRCDALDGANQLHDVPDSKPLGHHFVENTNLSVTPTEYASGHSYFTCTRCSETLQIEIPKFAHGAGSHTFQKEDGSIDINAGEIRKAASCEEDGEMVFTCEGCGATAMVAIPATGHSYTNEVVEIENSRIEPTCTTAGQYDVASVCSVCEAVDADTTVTVIVSPPLGHEWGEWEDADKETSYPCTAEREQIRTCQRTGCTEVETRMGGETNHTWDEDNVTCTVCGYISNGHHVRYMLNGGIAPQSLADIAEKAHKPGNTEVLWQPSGDETLGGAWTRQTAIGQAVFAGWSASNLGAAPFEADPEAEFISSVVIPENADAVVYAVWAVDKNKNGKPDYEETSVSIIYNANGGTGDVPAQLTGVLPGAAYPLETKPSLQKGDDVFAGWSTTAQSSVIENTGSEAIITSLVTSPFTVPADSTGDVTLYAVYAKDIEPKNGKPDFCEDALHVEYYINGGQIHDGYSVDEDGMFYVCDDYHHHGETASLLAQEHGGMMIYRENAVLLGWSKDPCDELVTSEERANELLIKTIDLPSDENAKVYALWAADVNNNSLADYTEATLTHTYHQNQYLSQSNGSTLPLGYYLNVTTPVPAHQTGILPGIGVELADDNYLGSADLIDDKGNVAGHYVQVGWSGYSHGACMSQTDYTNWVIAGDQNGYTDADGTYYRIIYDMRFQNAYAVWAPDENENDIADFKENHNSGVLPGVSPLGGSSTVCDGGDACPSHEFADVDHTAWYHEGVDYVIKNKLMVGKADGSFAPNGITTRAEMVQILYRLDGEPAVTESAKFDDVAAGQWYSDAVSWAAANKIVDGYGNGKFGTNDTITREQMAAILYRYAEYKGYDLTKSNDLTGYTDAASVSGWAEAAMKWIVAEGIIEGTSTTTLSPSGDSTRAQVATIFMRFGEDVAK